MKIIFYRNLKTLSLFCNFKVIIKSDIFLNWIIIYSTQNLKINTYNYYIDVSYLIDNIPMSFYNDSY